MLRLSRNKNVYYFFLTWISVWFVLFMWEEKNVRVVNERNKKQKLKLTQL